MEMHGIKQKPEVLLKMGANTLKRLLDKNVVALDCFGYPISCREYKDCLKSLS